MMLFTHEIIGVTLAKSNPSLWAGFFIAFASHYFLDFIPHWHYKLGGLKPVLENPGSKPGFSEILFLYRRGFLKIFLDGLIGLIIVLMIFPPASWRELLFILFSAGGAILPDFLSGISIFWPNRFLAGHYRFHDFIHARIRLDDQLIIGLGSQIVLIILAVFFGYFVIY